uniref:Zn-ribbon-containing, possibly nucleic-acid-binding protein n=1 Tax=Rheinheimera sp. BAL341 TaxID=1708203 RepID=A0A486XK01_9GAMM
MYVAELMFKVISDTEFSLAEQAIRRYIEALIFNGQVLGREFPTAWQQDRFTSRLVLPAEDALLQKYHSKRGLTALHQLSEAGLAFPQWQQLGIDLMSPHSSPNQRPEFYILYSRFSDTCSPVYYALYSGSSKDCRNENNKLCPGCGAKWRLSAPLHELFDFKCDKCRLLSNIAWDCQSPS